LEGQKPGKKDTTKGLSGQVGNGMMTLNVGIENMAKLRRFKRGTKEVGKGGKSDWSAKEWRSGRKEMVVGKKSNGAMDLGRGKKDEKRAARTG